MNICELENVKKQLGSFSFSTSSFSLKKGAFYAFIGPNGSGKSTFLDILSMVTLPNNGNYRFLGKIINSSTGSIVDFRRKISYLQQNPYIFSSSVYDNIAMGLRFRNINEKTIKKKVEILLEQLSLTQYKNKPANSLSGGEKQRVAIARTLAVEAELYLFDEVTANIDIENVSAVENLLKNLQLEKKATVVITTHSKRQAYRLSKNVISIINGKISNTLYENIFTGLITEKSGDIKAMKISEKVEILLISENSGKATISIPPEDIIVSKSKLESSAVNSFKGTIFKIENRHDVLKLSIDIGVKINTLITKLSFDKLGLNINTPVFVTFKANCVKILTG